MPLKMFEGEVQSEWIDEFGHVNVAHYITICDQANWTFWNHVNAPADMEARDGHEYVILENHVHYINELTLGEQIYVMTRMLGLDDKRFILFHEVFRSADGALAATNEAKFIGFNLKSRRVESFADTAAGGLQAVWKRHATLERPDQAGQGIFLKQ